MKLKSSLLSIAICSLLFNGCTSEGGFDFGKAAVVGVGMVTAATLSESQVKQTSALAAKEMDSKTQVAAANSQYARRLSAITSGLESRDGLQLNFKVYMNEEVNAFAMADGTVRVHSGLLDAMPDDQVLAVIGHEIGHVKLKHSYKQMKQKLLSDSAIQAAVSVGGTIGALTSSQLGQLAYGAANAKFSRDDEHESDVYAVKTLKAMGKDPYAMKRAIETLQKKYGAGGGFLSSHPSNANRISQIEEAIARL